MCLRGSVIFSASNLGWLALCGSLMLLVSSWLLLCILLPVDLPCGIWPYPWLSVPFSFLCGLFCLPNFRGSSLLLGPESRYYIQQQIEGMSPHCGPCCLSLSIFPFPLIGIALGCGLLSLPVLGCLGCGCRPWWSCCVAGCFLVLPPFPCPICRRGSHLLAECC